MSIRHISALTLLARDPGASIAFYEKLGFEVEFGGADAEFTTLRAGEAYVNLIAAPGHRRAFWGRAVVRVDDVDALHRRITAAGLAAPAPEDAPWGERYFHLQDPDGHELSFAETLEPR